LYPDAMYVVPASKNKHMILANSLSKKFTEMLPRNY